MGAPKLIFLVLPYLPLEIIVELMIPIISNWFKVSETHCLVAGVILNKLQSSK